MTRTNEAALFAQHPEVPLAQVELSFRRMDYMVATENFGLFNRMAKALPAYAEQRDYYRLQMQNAAKAVTRAQRNYERVLEQVGLKQYPVRTKTTPDAGNGNRTENLFSVPHTRNSILMHE